LTILRFKNEEVLNDLFKVMESIKTNLLHLSPSL
jgi:very-short-patch-repair endonuclease